MDARSGPMAVLHPWHNAHGKRDVTGAFRPEARRFCDLHDVSAAPLVFDNTAPKGRRRREVERMLRTASPQRLACVAIFCHGYRSGLQTGHANRHVKRLAELLHEVCEPDAVVSLYACSAGAGVWRKAPGGDGGFADRLRDAMSAAGMAGGWVDAHTTVAHTTKNPMLRRFYTDGEPAGAKGGSWVVTPRSPLWRAWRLALRETDLRLRFPLMTVEAIHAELRQRQEQAA